MILIKKITHFIHISLTTDINKLFPLISQNQNLNFEVLQQIAKIYKHHQHKFTQQKQQKICKQLLKYSNRIGRKDKIATIGWIIIKLKLFPKLKQLMNQFAHRIDQDQWYVNFQESVRAMQSFYWIQDRQLRNRIYQKIQRNVTLTIWQVNMKYYQRLSTSLILAKRFDAPLWEKLEYHIMRNLDMEYHVQTILQIFLNFAMANKGTKDFYHILQLTVTKGHLFLSPIGLKGLRNHSYSSQLIAPIIKTFALAKKNLNMDIQTEFKIYLIKIIQSRFFQLQQLGHLTTIVQYLKQYQFDKQTLKQIYMEAFKKLKTIQNYIYLSDVIEFYQKMSLHQIQLSQQIIKEIGSLTIYSILRGPKNVQLALQVYSYLHKNNLLGNKQYQIMMDQWLQQQSQYFDKSNFKVFISTMKQMNKKVEYKTSHIKIGISAKYQNAQLLEK